MKINLSKEHNEFNKDSGPKSNRRMHKLKFYADNQQKGYTNKLFTFETEDEKTAISLLFDFEKNGNNIRAVFLTPSDKNLSKKISAKFDYKNHPVYEILTLIE